ncbi:MAG: hypothetical protein Kow0032_28640 [Methyloligellaceae bacterium]
MAWKDAMRTLIASMMIALPAALAAAPPSAAQEEPLVYEARVGAQFLIKLPGNPQAGYRWQLNKEKSSGIELVDVDFIGWLMAPETRSYFFKRHSIQNISIKPKAPGTASLAFEYYRNWGNRATLRTRMVTVHIRPAEPQPQAPPAIN